MSEFNNLTNELLEVDERPITCEERLKACEVQLMLNRANADQVKQHQLAYDQACQDIKQLRAQTKALENEIEALRQSGARNINAMQEYLQLIENLDFRVEGARLRFLVDYDHFYLRFDRNGQIKHAWSPEEYNKVIAKEWEAINNINESPANSTK